MLFLSQMLGMQVCGQQQEPIGRLDDLIVYIGEDAYPAVYGMVVRDRRRRFFVPGTNLLSINGNNGSAQLNSSVVDLQPFQRRDGEVLLGTDVLDHQIIDITGRRIVRVNDVQLAQVEDKVRVVGVDVSPQALVRRLGPRAWRDRIVGRQIIDWSDAQYLASAAPVQLKVSYDRLSDLNPVDLARIVDALSYRESAEIVAALDDETAAETLEEVSDERLADLLEGMDQERAADILEEMAPNAAADILEDLDDEIAEQILARMEPEEAADVQELLAYEEDRVGRIMTTDFVGVPAQYTVGQVLAHIRGMQEIPDPLLAIYVVSTTDPEAQHPQDGELTSSQAEPGQSHSADSDQQAQDSVLHDDEDPFFLGIVRLRSLILADPDIPITDVMDDDTPTVHAEAPAEEAARVLAEYNLLAVPVLNDARRMLGIVTVDDALAVLLPDIWQRRNSVFA